MMVVGFSLFLTTKSSIAKFEVEGTTTLTGKDAEINRMLEVDLETKMHMLFRWFTGMHSQPCTFCQQF